MASGRQHLRVVMVVEEPFEIDAAPTVGSLRDTHCNECQVQLSTASEALLLLRRVGSGYAAILFPPDTNRAEASVRSVLARFRRDLGDAWTPAWLDHIRVSRFALVQPFMLLPGDALAEALGTAPSLWEWLETEDRATEMAAIGALAAEMDDDLAEARVLEQLAHQALDMPSADAAARYRGAIILYGKALALLDEGRHRRERARLLFGRGYAMHELWLLEPDLDLARSAAQALGSVLESIEPGEDPPTYVRALLARTRLAAESSLEMGTGTIGEAIDLAERGLILTRQFGQSSTAAFLHNNLGCWYMVSSRLNPRERLDRAEEHFRACLAIGEAEASLLALVNLIDLYTRRSELGPFDGDRLNRVINALYRVLGERSKNPVMLLTHVRMVRFLISALAEHTPERRKEHAKALNRLLTLVVGPGQLQLRLVVKEALVEALVAGPPDAEEDDARLATRLAMEIESEAAGALPRLQLLASASALRVYLDPRAECSVNTLYSCIAEADARLDKISSELDIERWAAIAARGTLLLCSPRFGRDDARLARWIARVEGSIESIDPETRLGRLLYRAREAGHQYELTLRVAAAVTDAPGPRLRLELRIDPADHVSLSLHDGQEIIVASKFQLQDPITIAARRSLRWYLESYPELVGDHYADRAREVEAAMIDWGTALYHSVFGGAVARRIYDLVERRGLGEVGFFVTDARAHLRSVPWDLLYDPGERRFITPEFASFTRSGLVRTGGVGRRVEGRPLRILLLIARPINFSGHGDYRVVARPMMEALGRFSHCVELTALEPPTRANLEAALRRLDSDGGSYFDILHIDAHGVFDAAALGGNACILLEDDARAVAPLTADALADLLRPAPPPLVVMNACRSTAGDRDDDVERNVLVGLGLDRVAPAEDPKYSARQTLAAAALSAGVSAVVGMQFEVLIGAAARAIESLYAGMAGGESVGLAVQRARRALRDDNRRTGARTTLRLRDWFVLDYHESRDPLVWTGYEPGPDKGRLQPRIVGREEELADAVRLLRSDKARALLVTGLFGSGRLSFLIALAEWVLWTKPAFASGGVFHVLGDGSVMELDLRGGRDIDLGVAVPYLRDHPCLLIVGSVPPWLDEVTWPKGGARLAYSAMKYVVDGQHGHLNLDGLRDDERRVLALEILAANGGSGALDDPACEDLFELLQGNPLAIHTTLPHLRDKTPGGVRATILGAPGADEQLAAQLVEPFSDHLGLLTGWLADGRSQAARQAFGFLSLIAGPAHLQGIKPMVDHGLLSHPAWSMILPGLAAATAMLWHTQLCDSAPRGSKISVFQPMTPLVLRQALGHAAERPLVEAFIEWQASEAQCQLDLIADGKEATAVGLHAHYAPNIRHALELASRYDLPAFAPPLVHYFQRLWFGRGRRPELLRLLESCAGSWSLDQLDGAVDERARMSYTVHYQRASTLLALGKAALAAPILEALRRWSRATGQGEADVDFLLGQAHAITGDLAQAIHRHRASEQADLGAHSALDRAKNLHHIGDLEAKRGNHEQGIRLLRESVEILRATRQPGSVLVVGLTSLATLLHVHGHYTEAEPLAREGLHIAVGIGDRSRQRRLALVLSVCCMELGKRSEAIALLETCVALSGPGDSPLELSNIYYEMGLVYYHMDEHEMARRCFLQASEHGRFGRLSGMLGVLALTAGDGQDALGHFIEALSLFERDNQVEDCRRTRANLRRTVDRKLCTPEEFELAWRARRDDEPPLEILGDPAHGAEDLSPLGAELPALLRQQIVGWIQRGLSDDDVLALLVRMSGPAMPPSQGLPPLLRANFMGHIRRLRADPRC